MFIRHFHPKNTIWKIISFCLNLKIRDTDTLLWLSNALDILRYLILVVIRYFGIALPVSPRGLSNIPGAYAVNSGNDSCLHSFQYRKISRKATSEANGGIFTYRRLSHKQVLEFRLRGTSKKDQRARVMLCTACIQNKAGNVPLHNVDGDRCSDKGNARGHVTIPLFSSPTLPLIRALYCQNTCSSWTSWDKMEGKILEATVKATKLIF